MENSVDLNRWYDSENEDVPELKYVSLFFLFLAFVFLAAGPAGLLGLEGREGSQVDLLLGGGPHQELGGVDDVSADLDVPLVDEDSGLMDALGLEAFLVDSSLEPLVEEFVEGETEHIVEFEFLIAEETVPVHSVEEGSTFEQPPGVLLLKGEQLSGSLPELGEQEVHSPYLSLALEAVLADQLQLVVDSFLLEGSSRGFKCCRIYIDQRLQFL